MTNQPEPIPSDGICHKHMIMGCTMCSAETPSKQLEPSLRELLKTELFAAIEYGRLNHEATQNVLEATYINHLDDMMEYVNDDKEAAEGVSILLKSDLAWCLGKLRSLGHPSEMLEVRHGFAHPQAGEGEGK